MLSDSTNNIITCKESRLTHNEDHEFHSYSILSPRTEEEWRRIRREWQVQQERERQLEELEQQTILEYERERAQPSKYAEGKSSHHNRSKSGSESNSYLRSRFTSTASKSGNLHEK